MSLRLDWQRKSIHDRVVREKAKAMEESMEPPEPIPECPDGQQWDDSYDMCVCPSDKPFWNDKTKECVTKEEILQGGET
jgi:hypothetical protein